MNVNGKPACLPAEVLLLTLLWVGLVRSLLRFACDVDVYESSFVIACFASGRDVYWCEGKSPGAPCCIVKLVKMNAHLAE